jgi:chemotaxis protein MotB
VILFSFSTLDEHKFDQMSEKMAEAFKAKDGSKTSESDVGVTSESRQLRALQMLVTMLNLGDNVDDAVANVERSFADGKTLEGAKALLDEKLASDAKSVVNSIQRSNTDEFRTIELVLPDSSLFASGSYRLRPAARPKIRSLAQDLRLIDGLAEIEVVGHTDGQPPARGSAYDGNFTLSSLRAGAIAAELLRFGVDERKLTVRGMGSLKPLAPERDGNGKPLPENMAKNRRVSILLKVRAIHAAVAH